MTTLQRAAGVAGTRRPGRLVPAAVVALGLAGLVTSGLWVSGGGPARFGFVPGGTTSMPAAAMMGAGMGAGMMATGMMGTGMMGTGMMGTGAAALPGNGRPVRSLAAARERAAAFATPLDLSVGEVMQFRNHFYAQLHAADRSGATEVLVDPRNGAVQVEFGPAMMWNTAYGMGTGMGGAGAPGPGAAPLRAAPPAISATDARAVADRWLQQAGSAARAQEPTLFPGYYTMDVAEKGRPTGMLSVHATTGAVWFHAWHGPFVAMSEGPG